MCNTDPNSMVQVKMFLRSIIIFVHLTIYPLTITHLTISKVNVGFKYFNS